MLEEMMRAHAATLRISQTTIEHRMEWEQVSRIERLERALKVAKSKLNFLPTLSARTN